MTSYLSEAVALTENARTVLAKRYLRRDNDGIPIEAPEDMFWRVARTIADADSFHGKDGTQINKIAEDFYKLMTNLYFMPNSPTLMNAGRELGQLSACFVLPIDDSLDAIFEAVKNTALIHKSGGGTGFSFSRLRPRNDIVRSTMGVSSGPVSFLEVFNAATEAVKQGGTRRGANMAILRIDHPDILEFINAKYEGHKLNNFNISVGITNEFMEAVLHDEYYDLIHPNTKKSVKQLKAKEVFDVIVDHAWRNGEPGIVFLDRINADNPTPKLGQIESTNPCGEVPLLPYEACNLGSINLGRMVKYNEENQPEVDWGKLEYITKLSTHFLDNVITMNNFPLPQIEEMVRNNRKIGLGVMGWADLLMAMNIPYNAEEGTQLARQVMEFIDYHSKVKSVELAQERGKFLNFEGSIYDGNEFLYEKYKGKSAGIISGEDWKELDAKIQKFGIRNATTTCIAPTGTISMIAGASGGVEPLFALTFVRKVMDGTELLEVNPIFKDVAEEKDFYSEELMKQIATKGTIHGIESIPEDVQEVFVTAHDITPEWHVKMQAAFQLHTDNAVSKTVNFTEEGTREEIAETYYLAYKSDLKGITVYRNNSRSYQPMSIEVKGDNKDQSSESDQAKYSEIAAKNAVTPRQRPNLTYGLTDKIQTGCGPLYVTINVDEEGLCEVFARMGKSGGCATSQAEATGRMISLALRAGVDITSIIGQLKGIRCPAPAVGKGGVILSCSDAISKVLERNLEKALGALSINGDAEYSEISYSQSSKADLGICPECPECGQMLEFSEGCVLCKNCGFSRCS
ncbi:MAG: ribonucleotide-diphosphate reductase subunit alpha [Candidatus Melainabacteria bacterium RIFOXYA12_FULL_32_12]|nr:MAG: ribonucleotide-diphosphate reductase subunit alpha [Candidatus Melainabacteria bacterium RIFOXYA2_FULL_32_9]OGI25237.1 MAG: ribonucleotide-diphosphate reductase subunit alpha [Candidatus Melainabacteria bacterium RIFOXYA12_FULL_32_12]